MHGIMRRILFLVIFAGVLGAPELFAASLPSEGPAFPLPLHAYADAGRTSILEILRHRIAADPFNLVASIIFVLAIVHTFLATKFMHLAHEWRDQHAAKVRVRGGTEESAAMEGAKEPVSFKAEVMHFLGF